MSNGRLQLAGRPDPSTHGEPVTNEDLSRVVATEVAFWACITNAGLWAATADHGIEMAFSYCWLAMAAAIRWKRWVALWRGLRG